METFVKVIVGIAFVCSVIFVMLDILCLGLGFILKIEMDYAKETLKLAMAYFTAKVSGTLFLE